ncbi:MAG: periplasmic heavy metal sensor [Candidatus Margulisbacteria bacterium]|nr:periplasmic heavy metal sensor [Candidatus Margulisiibacteriota bacterium]
MFRKILISVVVFLISLSALAYAAEEDFVKKLDLSPAQVKQIKAQRQEQDRVRDQIREQIRVKEQALKEEVDKEEPNQNRIRAMVQEINQLRSKAFEDRVNALLETKKVLTREQFREMTKLQLRDGTGDELQYKHRSRIGESQGKNNRKGD